MTSEINKFIDKNRELFWYIPDEKIYQISNEQIVETILNYGTLDDFYLLIEIFGLKKVAEAFYCSINKSNRARGNYHKSIINFFDLVFRRYGVSDIK